MRTIADEHRHHSGRVLFLADLHLDNNRPAMLECFRAFCRSIDSTGTPVYILGDLFEVWIGDDDDSPLATTVIHMLSTLTASGTPVWFMRGNRDFLIGDEFLARCGMRPLEDPTLIDLFGVRTLLCHGDTLCTDDAAYQQFRAEVRTREWQRSFLSRPLDERRRIAANLRDDSQDAMGDKDASAMDVTISAVADTAAETGAQRLIHGHTHRPAHHEHEVCGQRVDRWVLADWYEQPAVLTVSATEIANLAPEDVSPRSD